jgi:hypothetical protein
LSLGNGYTVASSGSSQRGLGRRQRGGGIAYRSSLRKKNALFVQQASSSFFEPADAWPFPADAGRELAVYDFCRSWSQTVQILP